MKIFLKKNSVSTVAKQMPAQRYMFRATASENRVVLGYIDSYSLGQIYCDTRTNENSINLDLTFSVNKLNNGYYAIRAIVGNNDIELEFKEVF